MATACVNANCGCWQDLDGGCASPAKLDARREKPIAQDSVKVPRAVLERWQKTTWSRCLDEVSEEILSALSADAAPTDRLNAAAPELLDAADYASGQWRCGDGEHRDAAGRNWAPEACPGCRLRAAIQKATTP